MAERKLFAVGVRLGDSGLFDAMAVLNRHEAALVKNGWTFADGEGGRREFRAPDQKCPECGRAVTFLTRNMCADCRAAAVLEPYGYIDGRCFSCGATDGGHRMVDGQACEVIE